MEYINSATDNLNKSGIFKKLCLEQNIVVLVLSYLIVLTVLFCNLIRGAEGILLAFPQLSIE